MVITPTPVSGMPNTPFTPENSMDVNPNSGALKPPGSDVPVPSSSVITPVIPSTLANLPAIPAWGQAPLSQGTATVTPPAQPAGLFGISTAISAATGIVNSEQNPARRHHRVWGAFHYPLSAQLSVRLPVLLIAIRLLRLAHRLLIARPTPQRHP